MQGHLKVLLRILLQAKLLLGISFLYGQTLAKNGAATVFDTVYAQCIVILVSLWYYGVARFFWAACFPSKPRPHRVSLVPRDADGNYVDLQITSATELIHGAPKLTIHNVWVLVYGVGIILFIVGYCILGLNPLCQACFGLGVCVLAVDELVCPRHPMSKLYTSARSAAFMAGFISLMLVSSELLDVQLLAFASTLDLYSLIFGICLPIVAQFLMIAVRDNRRYSLGSVVEVCEFGLPFTAFLGVFHLSVAYGQRFQLTGEASTGRNQTWSPETFASLVQADWPVIIFHSLSPLLVCPLLVAYISCVLEGSSIDPLLSVCLALCVHYLFERPASALGIYGTVCCALAIVVRVLSEYSPTLHDWRLGPGADNAQLPHEVVWQRDSRRAREAEELTQDLELVAPA
jgi:hypothetical protein